MWYVLTDDKGNSYSYGFGPIKEGEASGPGAVNPHGPDDVNYKGNFNEGGGDYQRHFNITEEQFVNMWFFGEHGLKVGYFKSHYNGIENSCVDFVWKALEKGGFQTNGFEGDVLPINNIDDIRKLKYPNSIDPTPEPNPIPNPGIIDPIDDMGDAEQAQMRRYDPLTFDMDK
jgi:hypothetical protein